MPGLSLAGRRRRAAIAAATAGALTVVTWATPYHPGAVEAVRSHRYKATVVCHGSSLADLTWTDQSRGAWGRSLGRLWVYASGQWLRHGGEAKAEARGAFGSATAFNNATRSMRGRYWQEVGEFSASFLDGSPIQPSPVVYCR